MVAKANRTMPMEMMYSPPGMTALKARLDISVPSIEASFQVPLMIDRSKQ